MNRIQVLFNKSDKPVLSVYFCAGHPTPDSTAEIISALEQAGVQMVEVGIPFSDPMADGSVIQEASAKALAGGMSLRRLFGQLRGIRERVSIPIILMGYLNPIMQFGFEHFCRCAAEVGADGMIIPDLPFREYLLHYRDTAERYGLSVIMLITPETSEERIREIDTHTAGFIYMVSSAAVTGEKADFSAAQKAYFRRISGMGLRNPLMIGFGISNNRTYRSAAEQAQGVIIGSRFVRALSENPMSPADAVNSLLSDIGILPLSEEKPR